MSSFSSTEAAFEGFRLTREHPRAVLVWAAVYFVFTLALALLTVAWVGPDFAMVQALNQAQNPDPAQVMAVLRKLGPYFLVVLPAEVVFFAVLTCAIYRAVLRPNERGLAYFKLGVDEARMVALWIILFVLWLFSIFLAALVAGTLGAFGSPPTAFLGFLISAGMVCLAIWIFVRLSLAAPMTFDQQRLVVFGSWGFTRGSFWPLFGAYVLAFLLAVVIFILMAVISTALWGVAVMATGGSLNGVGHGMSADVSSMHAFLTVPTVLSQGCGAALMTVYYVIVLSPSAIAYQGLAGRSASGF